MWESTSLEAHKLVFGDRNATYDHPIVDYERTAALFNAMTGLDIDERQAITFMLCVKMSRIGAGMEMGLDASTVRDSLVDLAGYADCLFAVWEELDSRSAR